MNTNIKMHLVDGEAPMLHMEFPEETHPRFVNMCVLGLAAALERLTLESPGGERETWQILLSCSDCPRAVLGLTRHPIVPAPRPDEERQRMMVVLGRLMDSSAMPATNQFTRPLSGPPN